MDSRLLGLIVVFAPLSLFSFGGGQAVVADVQYQTVNVHGWLTNEQFTDLYAVSRAAPGPSTLIAALIGWQVYGLIGSIVACIAVFVPSSIVVYSATSWWHRNEKSPWRAAIQKGLGPVAVGLIFAGILAVLRAAHIVEPGNINYLGLATTLTAGVVLYYTKISSYYLIGSVAILYACLPLVS
jgi:chromate transporter